MLRKREKNSRAPDLINEPYTSGMLPGSRCVRFLSQLHFLTDGPHCQPLDPLCWLQTKKLSASKHEIELFVWNYAKMKQRKNWTVVLIIIVAMCPVKIMDACGELIFLSVVCEITACFCSSGA